MLAKPEPEPTPQADEEEESVEVIILLKPENEEFEVDLPGDITGAEIIQELVSAEVLTRGARYALVHRESAKPIGASTSLNSLKVKSQDTVIIKRL